MCFPDSWEAEITWSLADSISSTWKGLLLVYDLRFLLSLKPFFNYKFYLLVFCLTFTKFEIPNTELPYWFLWGKKTESFHPMLTMGLTYIIFGYLNFEPFHCVLFPAFIIPDKPSSIFLIHGRQKSQGYSLTAYLLLERVCF